MTIFIPGPFGLRNGPRSEYGVDFKTRNINASNLEEKFNLYCNLENLEINYNQLLVIQKLQDFYKKF